MTIDTKPGKYSSATGQWYLSCDTGKSVLVGIQEPKQWTCPIVGLQRYEITVDQLLALESRSIIAVGDTGGLAIRVVSTHDWNRIMNDDLEEEWFMNTATQCFITTDTEEVVRLHMAFE